MYFKQVLFAFLYSFIFAQALHAQVIDFTKAIVVQEGIYAGSFAYDQPALYTIRLSKGANLKVSISAAQANNTSQCATSYYFSLYDSFKFQVKKSYSYFNSYFVNEIFGDELALKANRSELHYAVIIPKLEYKSNLKCNAEASQVRHDITFSLETTGNKTAGPDSDLTELQRQCGRAQKYYCREQAVKRKWSKTKSNQCIKKRKAKFCGL